MSESQNMPAVVKKRERELLGRLCGEVAKIDAFFEQEILKEVNLHGIFIRDFLDPHKREDVRSIEKNLRRNPELKDLDAQDPDILTKIKERLFEKSFFPNNPDQRQQHPISLLRASLFYFSGYDNNYLGIKKWKENILSQSSKVAESRNKLMDILRSEGHEESRLSHLVECFEAFTEVMKDLKESEMTEEDRRKRDRCIEFGEKEFPKIVQEIREIGNDWLELIGKDKVEEDPFEGRAVPKNTERKRRRRAINLRGNQLQGYPQNRLLSYHTTIRRKGKGE